MNRASAETDQVSETPDTSAAVSLVRSSTPPHVPTVRLLLLLVVIFLLCHSVLTATVSKYWPSARAFEPVLESIVLLAVLSPLLYFFVFRPLVAEIRFRWQTEEALRESEARFRAVTQSANEAIVVTDGEGKIALWNPGAARVFGYTEQEALGQPLALIIPPAKFSGHQEAMRQLQATGKSDLLGKTFEGRAVRKGGDEFAAEISLASWDSPKGRFCSASIRDITQRKQSEAQLREAELLYRTLYEQSPDGIMLMDPETTLPIAFNTEAHRQKGYSREEFARLRIPDYDAGQSPEEIRSTVAKVRRDGRADFEVKHRTKQGEVQDIRVTTQTIELGGRKLFHNVWRDITQRKQAEARLREAELRYRTLFEQSPDAIVIFDPETMFPIEFNTEAHRQLGYTREEFARLRIHDYDAGENPADIQTNFAKILREGRINLLVKHRTKAGEIRDVQVAVQALTLNGRTVCCSIWRDVTEQAQAELRIQEQAALLDITQDGILVRDFDYTIRYWNKGAERMYGWTATEALGHRTRELLYDTDALTMIEEVYGELHKNGTWHGELRHITKDRRKIIVEARLTLIYDARGTPTSVLCVNTEITEKKRLERQFLRAQRMESIGQLAGGIAHDLNNVLSPILMSAELLRPSLTDPESLKVLETVESSARRGGDIVRQVLTFARGVEGKRVAIQPRHLCNAILKLARETFPKNIRVEQLLPKDLWLVNGDATQIEQVLMNLCVNARDAMLKGGVLRLAAENQTVDESFATMFQDAQPGNFVCLTVSDTGTGMTPEVLDHIFEPFFTTKGQGEGTGLGLATTLGIVRSHGGFVQVTSVVGQGSQFKVLFPAITDSEAIQDETGTPVIPVGHGECILVVDDESSIRDVLRKILDRSGYEVLMADDGTEGLVLFAQQKGKIALIISDLEMPHMDGLTMSRAIRKMDPEAKILVSTGGQLRDGASNKLKELEGMGIATVLIKPYTKNALLMEIHKALHGHPVEPQMSS